MLYKLPFCPHNSVSFMLCGNWKTIFKHTFLAPQCRASSTLASHTNCSHIMLMDLGLSAPALKVKVASFRITKFNDAARNENNILTAVCIETGRLQCLLALGFCDRASWANCEEREREKTNKMKQSDIYYQLLSQNVSGIIMPIFRSSARTLQSSAPQPLPTTSSRTSAAHHMQ